MTDPMTLPQRIEAAEGAEQRHMLELAWQEVHGEFPGGCEWHSEANQRFARLLNAGAYLNAALTLVPEGYDWSLDNFDGDQGKPHAWVCKDGPFYNATAATPALALCAAALKAHIERNEG